MKNRQSKFSALSQRCLQTLYKLLTQTYLNDKTIKTDYNFLLCALENMDGACRGLLNMKHALFRLIKGPMAGKCHFMIFFYINMSSPSLPMVPQWLEMAIGVNQTLGILRRL